MIKYFQGFSLEELFVKKSTGDNASFTETKEKLRRAKNKFIYYDKKILRRSHFNFIINFLGEEILILLLVKSTRSKVLSHFLISEKFSELKFARYSKGSYMFPLYRYNKKISPNHEVGDDEISREPNLKSEVLINITKGLKLMFVSDHEKSYPLEPGTYYSPLDILDYIYAVLHSPTYREKYKEFLKIDFPRVPYPKNQETFWQLVKLGGEIRQIHLLESPKVEQYITQYPINGNNEVTRKITKSSPGYVPDNETQGKVWINDEQYFDNVPLIAWEFYIGGYQPAQKWLKDRKGRQLEFDDILHYQKIIVALSETDRLMKEIDEIEII
ncbi:hypothetical protein LB456_08995 [Psychroflexus sp. CAK57W]|uniref:type ISP restriction/modification enzyme n=1 Tax=Psychroflexus curvus TaxID=2873595 RepID=UPI001CC95557|nr:type ISP restriction/modification enzyme [Psychroflexus curvus]MBZ9787590.1 hypothetical protein [Psychroflexus curvus]